MATAAARPKVVKAAKTSERPASRISVGQAVEVILPLLLLALLITLCVQLLVPFVGLLLWTTILAVCFYPVHLKLQKRGLSNRMSAIIIGVVLSAFILVPTTIAAVSAASSVPELVSTIQSGDRQVSPPPERLQSLPVIGEKAHALWTQASNDLPAFVNEYRPQLTNFAKW